LRTVRRNASHRRTIADHAQPIQRLLLAYSLLCDAAAAVVQLVSAFDRGALTLYLLQMARQSRRGCACAAALLARCILPPALKAFQADFREVVFAGRGHTWLGDPLDLQPPRLAGGPRGYRSEWSLISSQSIVASWH
jgi:2-dehydropantoate 2-reductase